MSRKGTLSATNLAIHHHLSCDLYLYNVYHGPAPGCGSTSTSTSSEISKAQFERGTDWETLLFSWLDKTDLLLTVPSAPLQANELRENIQADDRDHFFIAGLTFWPPKDALNAHFLENGTESLNFGLAKLDLLEIIREQDGHVTWKVIDAKASNVVKTSHHAQIYFYTLCLTHLLPRPHFLPSGTAGIWLPPAEGFTSSPPSLDDLKTINISLLSSSLNHFLFRELPRMLACPHETIEWHYNPLCRSCPYESGCRSRALRDGELGSMPNISLDEAGILKRFLAISRREQSPLIVEKNQITDIEDLHILIADRPKLDGLERLFPSTTKRAKRILGLSARNRNASNASVIVEAARTNTIGIKLHHNFTCPRHEDIAVMMSLVLDPSLPGAGIATFCISIFTLIPSLPCPQRVHGNGGSLVPDLAHLIRTILDHRQTPTPARTQFYVFSPSEQAALQIHLINIALTSPPSNPDIRLCIGALAEGASLLQTTFQPLLLSCAHELLFAKGRRSKVELQQFLERMDLPTEGTVEQLRTRLQDGVRRLQAEGGWGIGDDDRRTELGQLPRVVTVKKEVERLLALPLPGYWDLPECASTLLPLDSPESKCPSDEDIFKQYKNGTLATLNHALEKRNQSILAVLRSLRNLVSSTSRPQLLVNDAKVLSAGFMDICREDNLRKLFFMQQFEMLAKLTELWRSRIDGCPDGLILEYHSTKQGPKGIEHVFYLISGDLDMPAADKDRAFYDHLLVQDEDCDDKVDGGSSGYIPVEALFDDLGVSGLVFPLNKYTKVKWSAQHPVVQRKLFVADLRDVVIEDQKTKVALQTWGGWDVKLVEGCQYRLSPRLVDFNMTKILSTLLEFDLRSLGTICQGDWDNGRSHDDVPFLQLILDPRSLSGGTDDGSREEVLKIENNIQKSFRELNNLDVTAAEALVLKSSQRRAAQRILSSRLSVIWGPPGTGKTYTISLSLLRLLDVQHRLGDTTRKIIFITAMTHAAIQAWLRKFSYLVGCYRAIDSMPAQWLDNVRVEHVLKGNGHPAPPSAGSSTNVLYAGTVYQLYNFTKRHSFKVDCVIVDEAGQLSLGSTALALRSLSSTGRIIIAGDSEQLAPILTAQYPQLQSRRLFGSILDCLMHMSKSASEVQPTYRPPSPSQTELSEISSSQGSIVQLTENFRLNPDLGEFVSTIYSRAFKPQKPQGRQLGTTLKLTGNYLGVDLGVQPDVLKDVQAFLLDLADFMLGKPQALGPLVLSPCANASDHMKTTGASNPSTTPRPISLALIRLQTRTDRFEGVSYELHVRGEAAVAAALVTSLQRCSPEADIFVATPHRIQRQAVKAALDIAQLHDKDRLVNAMEKMNIGVQSSPDVQGKVTVDTIERLQGSEAEFVICLFSLPQSSTSGLGFLLERRRLNVAISRTRSLCVLVASSEVLRPSVKVLANEENAKGYTFLRAFEERAWSSVLEVNLDNF